jgi:hypothetical protein
MKMRMVLGLIMVIGLLLSGVALASHPGWGGQPTGSAANQPANWEAWAAANGETWKCYKIDDPDYVVKDGLAYYTMPAPWAGWQWRLLKVMAANVDTLYWNPMTGGQYPSTKDSISHVILCQMEMQKQCEWIGETAWAAGTRYVERGNWATYTAPNGPVTLWAGQNKNAGTVSISGGVVTITLNKGWRFKDVPENVKIQGYDEAPSGNPAPGRFATKGYATGSSFSINAGVWNYYGVHVEVEWVKCY